VNFEQTILLEEVVYARNTMVRPRIFRIEIYLSAIWKGFPMPPSLAFILISKVYPVMVKIIKALITTYALLSTYYDWVERFRSRAGRGAARMYSLAKGLPVSSASVLGALSYWYFPNHETGFNLFFGQFMSKAFVVMAILILLKVGYDIVKPVEFKQPPRPWIRSRSRASLGY
jgi:hypothetical protein